ncbi:hypothetical protein QAD02_013479 [Eretmocerus hayati]|uniref:Uncharacterized protein n=2 Tax=Eretmocerus hayati TaxID=131215 RepID=A0ACC2P2S9_9HYME|nr:hypothetical protein QAD02_007548 [Eretmocerus hayati]KAJ8677692.1 hypothetical protein QAD02_013479 [Eretmocerus hayati]
MSRYEEYFDAQVGGGSNFLDKLGTLCTVESSQRGSGIGGFLGGVCRRVLPLLKRGTKEVGKEAVRAGYNVASDIAHGKLPLRNSIESRLRESGNVLKRKAEKKLSQLFDEPKYKRMKEPDVLQSLPDSGSESSETSEKKVKSARGSKSQKKLTKKSASKTQLKKKTQKKLRAIKDIFNS